MVTRHITRLKELVLTSPTPAEPLGYFFEHVAPHPEIERASQPSTSRLLVCVIHELLAQHCGRTIEANDHCWPFLLHARSYHFWHGGCLPGSGTAHVLYFEDVKTGLLSLVRSPAPGNVDCLRFSVLHRPGPSTRH